MSNSELKPVRTVPPVDIYTRNFYVTKVRLLLAMVGLPVRGKSYTANKITTFLSWIGIKTKIFNIIERRPTNTIQNHNNNSNNSKNNNNVNSNNNTNNNKQQSVAGKPQSNRVESGDNFRDHLEVLGKILVWLDAGGEVAIFDASNTTHERRTKIIETCNSYDPKVPVLFIENICDDPKIIAENFKQKLVNSADYKGVSVYDATLDLKTRIYHYERAYQTIDDDKLSYIKLINLQSMVICNRINGSVPQLLSSFLTSLHIHYPRVIYFSRPADCEPIDKDQLVIKTKFTERGESYAKRLAEFIGIRVPKRLQSSLVIYTGTSQACIETAKHIEHKALLTQTTNLNKMNTGYCRGLSTKTLKDEKPEIFDAWEKDRLNYRFPGGESYADLIQRLRNLVLELEQLTAPALVISHQAPIQALYCYFKGKRPHEAPHLQVPSHTIIELISTTSGSWTEKHYSL